jgi:hypothetical protein
MLSRMDAAQALADLTEISSQVVQVVILDRDGAMLATTIDEPPLVARFVSGVERLLDEADLQAQARGLSALCQLEASTLEGSVFAVRGSGRVIAATTRPDPTVGLVLYDLKRCLESLDEAGSAAGAEANGAERPKRSPPERAARRKADRPA